MNLKTLQKNAARLEELRATRVELDGMVSSLTEEANRLASSLENIDPRILLQVHPEGKHLPDKDAEKLQRLNALKEKISLVPGACANVERKAAVLGDELELSYQEACRECGADARAKLDRELMAEIERNLPRCGGDGRRAALAAKSALEHCELAVWVGWFGAHRTSGDIVGRITQLIDAVRRFEAGEPVRPSAGGKVDQAEPQS